MRNKIYRKGVQPDTVVDGFDALEVVSDDVSVEESPPELPVDEPLSEDEGLDEPASELLGVTIIEGLASSTKSFATSSNSEEVISSASS